MGHWLLVRTVYLGRAEDIEQRLAGAGLAEPEAVAVRSFGAAAAALKIAQELDLAATIDRSLGGRLSFGPLTSDEVPTYDRLMTSEARGPHMGA
jgi:hypothetical protein